MKHCGNLIGNLINHNFAVFLVIFFLLPYCIHGFVSKSTVTKPVRMTSRCPISGSLHRGSECTTIDAKKRNVVVIGGGFGGLYTALRLSHQVDKSSTNIYLIDPKERFVFLPLLYELSVGNAATAEVSPKYSELLEGSIIQFIRGQIENVDLTTKTCSLLRNESQQLELLKYDQLIIAVGNKPRIDLIPGAKEHAIPFYRLEDAFRLREKLQKLRQTRQNGVNITIIGAGYSGIELATNVAQYVKPWKGKVTIIDRNNRILPSSDEHHRSNSVR